MVLVAAWLILSAVVGKLAATRGRSSAGWFLLALAVSPVIAGLFLLASRDLGKARAVATPKEIPATLKGRMVQAGLYRVIAAVIVLAVVLLASRYGA
ncbi:hypothetical protein CAL14_05455 [Bordetella genomosp. 9]|nr:hypothetical protein CAL14_05455 [Bordetella genomosp. 9]